MASTTVAISGVKRERDESNCASTASTTTTTAAVAANSASLVAYEYTADELRQLQHKLTRELTVEETAVLPTKQAYMEGHQVFHNANDVFGFDGWKCDVRELKLEQVRREGPHWFVLFSALVRVTLKNGVTFHEVSPRRASKPTASFSFFEFFFSSGRRHGLGQAAEPPRCV